MLKVTTLVRKLLFATLTVEEATQLEAIHEAHPNTIEGLRSQALLLSNKGKKVSEIAVSINITQGSIRNWIARWEVDKLASLTPTKTSNRDIQSALLLARNEALCKRFDELYRRKRLRHDDVLQQLSKEFFITPRTIRGVLKNTLPQPCASAATAPAHEAAPVTQS